MSKEYLDKDGLLYFWGKIKQYVADHSGGSSSFVTETVTVFSSTSIAAYNHEYGTLNITKSGYYPLAISGWNSPDMRYFVPARLRLSAQSSGSGTISYDIYNAHSSAHSGSFSANILWIKV